MRIALVSDWFAPRIGGLERQVQDLASELATRGHEVHVITSTPGPQSGERGVIVHRLRGPRLPSLAVVGSRAGVRELDRLIEQGRFDVVHAHSALSPLSLLALRTARGLRIPSVLTEHSVLRGAGAQMLWALDHLVGWSDWPDVLTGVSRYVQHELEQLSDRTDVGVLHNGVSPAWWQQPVTVRDDGQLRLVSTMRLTRRKRPVDLVRLLARVVRELPRGTPVKLCLIGDGPEAKNVQREATRLGVAQHLEMAGWQPRECVRAWLARSSVFVLPTCKEALSIASLEALSAGLPVVAMDAGGVGDIVVDGREGFLVPDEEAFGDAVLKLLRDASLRQRMGASGREHVRRFGWDRVIGVHEGFYEAARVRQISTTQAAVRHDATIYELSLST